MKGLTKKEKQIKINGLQVDIEDEMEFVGLKPYSHNLISIRLSMISKLGGVKEANRVIVELGLEILGWSKIPENDT